MASKTAIEQAEAALVGKHHEILQVEYERAYKLAERMAIWVMKPAVFRKRTERQMHDEIVAFLKTAHDPYLTDDFEYE